MKPSRDKEEPKVETPLRSEEGRPRIVPKAGELDEDRGSPGRGTRMDITREATRSKRKPILIGAGIAVVALITLLLALMKPAAPSVQRNAVLIGTVERGPMVRAVRGPGT
ncbi:MAG: hypothetical protein V3W24_08725, partial [Gemmatimonadota bacterium]